MSKNKHRHNETQPTSAPDEGRNTQEFSSSCVDSLPHNPHLLRYLRETAKLTQFALAQKVHAETETVIEWETGRQSPNPRHQQALEAFFRIPAHGLAVEMKDILAQDFSAAYFGDPQARERLEWANKHRELGQALRIIPTLPKT